MKLDRRHAINNPWDIACRLSALRRRQRRQRRRGPRLGAHRIASHRIASLPSLRPLEREAACTRAASGARYGGTTRSSSGRRSCVPTHPGHGPENGPTPFQVAGTVPAGTVLVPLDKLSAADGGVELWPIAFLARFPVNLSLLRPPIRKDPPLSIRPTLPAPVRHCLSQHKHTHTHARAHTRTSSRRRALPSIEQPASRPARRA